jgi:ADP-ribosyl-[dinitrogen reductase] hydrolase
MTGGGPFGLNPGEWTDDTSMALCLAVSLIECKGFNARDQMDRYSRWMNEGYLSSNGTCFDVGNTVRASLARYRKSEDPFAGSTDPHTAGNGSIMRLAPVAMFFHPDHDAAIRWAAESSRTTHGAAECLDACRVLAAMLCRAFDGAAKTEVLAAGANLAIGTHKVTQIARGEYRSKSTRDIRGSAYVVDSLEAALWCFDTTDSFEHAVLEAVNLGDDADTTAAVSGQIAEAFYGAPEIPERWLSRLVMRSRIQELATGCAASSSSTIA